MVRRIVLSIPAAMLLAGCVTTIAGTSATLGGAIAPIADPSAPVASPAAPTPVPGSTATPRVVDRGRPIGMFSETLEHAIVVKREGVALPIPPTTTRGGNVPWRELSIFCGRSIGQPPLGEYRVHLEVVGATKAPIDDGFTKADASKVTLRLEEGGQGGVTIDYAPAPGLKPQLEELTVSGRNLTYRFKGPFAQQSWGGPAYNPFALEVEIVDLPLY